MTISPYTMETLYRHGTIDYIPYDDFTTGHSDIKCSKRKEIVHNLIEMDCGNWVIEVPVLYSGEDTSMIEKLVDEVTEAGGEGIMVNLSDAPYDCKRTSNILKVKKFKDADVRVLGVNEGTKVTMIKSYHQSKNT